MLCDSLDNYTLVACNISGSNAFFARNDLKQHFTPYPIERLYQPLRLNLRFLAAGHPPSVKWLKDSLSTTRSRNDVAIAEEELLTRS